MSITIDTLSAHLGLSTSTISKALNNYADVSQATKERVWAAVEELGYTPNTSARNLRRGRTDKLGLLINNPIEFLSDYIGDVMSGAALGAERRDQHLVLFTKQVVETDELRRICRAREVDGMLLIFDPTPKATEMLAKEKMPFVVFGRRSANPSVSYIAPDNFAGAYDLTQHLIEQGHRRIGFTTRPQLGLTSADRFAGYQQALKEAGILFDPDLVVETVAGQRDGAAAFEMLMHSAEPPTAIFTFYDLMAADAIEAAQKRGLAVPEDIAIAGFDGLRIGERTQPAITTVRQPLGEMGQRAIDLLMAQIDDTHATPMQQTMPVQLLKRESTKRQ